MRIECGAVHVCDHSFVIHEVCHVHLLALHESYGESAQNKFSYQTHLPSVDDLYIYFDEVRLTKC